MDTDENASKRDDGKGSVGGETEGEYTRYITGSRRIRKGAIESTYGNYRKWNIKSVLKGMFITMGVLLIMLLALSALLSNPVTKTFSTIGFGMSSGGYSSPSQGGQQDSQGDGGIGESGGTDTDQNNAALVGVQGTPMPSVNGAQGRVIIRTAQLSMLVKDVPAIVGLVKSAATQQGGYVSDMDMQAAPAVAPDPTENANVGGDDEDRPSPVQVYNRATITLKVPAENFDALMERLRVAGIRVLGESVQSKDVTEEYVDLQAQLRNLKTTEGRITQLMGRAERIEDVLTLDRELRQIQSEIERIQGRINYLQQSAALSTIVVSLETEPPPIQVASVRPDKGWDPVAIAGRAWDASLATLQGIATVLISVFVYIWWLVPIAIAAYLFSRVALRRTAQRPE